MSGLVFNGNKKTGLIYNVKNYLSGGSEHYLEYSLDVNMKQKIIPSIGTEYTSGYIITFTYKTDNFKLFKYDDIVNPLNYLPKYKFVLNNITQSEITGVELIYNGDGTFKLTGEFNISSTLYSSTKNTTSNITISLLDENNNFFVTDIELLSATVATSATTITFTSSTLTYENYSVTNQKIKQNLTKITTIPTSFINETRFITNSGTNTLEKRVTFTETENRKIY